MDLYDPLYWTSSKEGFFICNQISSVHFDLNLSVLDLKSKCT